MHAENAPPGHGFAGDGDGGGDGEGAGDGDGDITPVVQVPLSQPDLGWLQLDFNQHLG